VGDYRPKTSHQRYKLSFGGQTSLRERNFSLRFRSSLDKSYALVQSIAAELNFNVGMMFDEADLSSDQSTDDALAAFDEFHQKYLAPDAPGRKAYLEYRGRPMVFIFPKGGHTDRWKSVERSKLVPTPVGNDCTIPTVSA
jgi:hypothetical protein